MFAIAEFGSVVRGTQDANSDRDLLVVAERRAHFSLRERYTRRGYSVSTFAPQQLKAMQRTGSLFIQHLKRESRVLVDADGRFGRWLKQCDVVYPTEEELGRCRASIAFVNRWPNEPILIGWKADTLYCLSRDYLIKSLAKSGHVVFGLESIEASLHGSSALGYRDLGALKVLRAGKAAHRSGELPPVGTCEAIDAWIRCMGESCGVRVRGLVGEDVDEAVRAVPLRRFCSEYERLRTLEAVYLIAQARGVYHPEHDSVMEHIVSPNAYGSSQKRKALHVQRYLRETVDLLANKPLNRTLVPRAG